jgi:hypothetical protein
MPKRARNTLPPQRRKRVQIRLPLDCYWHAKKSYAADGSAGEFKFIYDVAKITSHNFSFCTVKSAWTFYRNMFHINDIC